MDEKTHEVNREGKENRGNLSTKWSGQNIFLDILGVYRILLGLHNLTLIYAFKVNRSLIMLVFHENISSF